jgi:hypothetical protein
VPGTTVPACKAAILTVLGAAGALTGVDRRWSPPTEGEDYNLTNEKIFFGDTEILDDNWTALGNFQRRETYRLTISAWVAQEGDDPQATETRVWAIWAAVQNALVADLQAGVPKGSASLLRAAGVRQFDQITALQSTGVFSPEAWGAKVDGRITFIADTT